MLLNRSRVEPGGVRRLWHDVVRACSGAVRGNSWQSVYCVQRVRNRTQAPDIAHLASG
jgi:hypothetical protein